jgi:3-oxoacyl-(acyl-carrier-protein) synthase/enoyl-CoA hydratase/carnithine racemase
MQEGVYYLDSVSDIGIRKYVKHTSKKETEIPLYHIIDSNENYIQLVLDVDTLSFLSPSALHDFKNKLFTGSKPVVITCSASDFGLGAQLNENEAFGEKQIQGLEYYKEFLQMMENSSAVIHVFCHGNTRGGSMGIPACADRVVCTPAATFGFPEIRRHGLPGYVSVPTLRRVSVEDAKWFMLTGDAFDAVTAKRIGLVDEICDSFVYTPVNTTRESPITSIDCSGTIIQDRFLIFNNPTTCLGKQYIPEYIRVVFIIVTNNPIQGNPDIEFWKKVHCPVILIANKNTVQSVLDWSTYMDLRYCVDDRPESLDFNVISDAHERTLWDMETYWNGTVQNENIQSFILETGQRLYEYRPVGMQTTLSLMRRGCIPFAVPTKNTIYDTTSDVSESKEHDKWIDVVLTEKIDWSWLESIWVQTEYKPVIFHYKNQSFSLPTSKLVKLSNVIRKPIFLCGNSLHPIGIRVDIHVQDINTLYKVLKRTDAYLIAQLCEFLPAPTYEQAMVAMGSILNRPTKIDLNQLSESVLYDLEPVSKRATLTLNEPFSQNALTKTLVEGMVRATIRCINDDVSHITIRANGKVFCAGGSLHEMTTSGTIQEIAYLSYVMYRNSISLSTVCVPIHTIIHGDVVGGGFVVSLLGTSISIKKGSSFTLGNNRRGVSPGGNLTNLIPTMLGRSACMQHYLFDEKSATISRIHPVEMFDEMSEQHKPTSWSSLIRRYDYNLLCVESANMAKCLKNGFAQIDPKQNKTRYSIDVQSGVQTYLEQIPEKYLHVSKIFIKDKVQMGYTREGVETYIIWDEQKISSYVDLNHIVPFHKKETEQNISLQDFLNMSKEKQNQVDIVVLPLAYEISNVISNLSKNHGQHSIETGTEESEEMTYLRTKPHDIETYIHGVFSKIASEVGVDHLEPTRPWQEVGFDSLSMVEYVHSLKRIFTGLNINDTTLFDYPTPIALNKHIQGLVHASEAPKPQKKPQNTKPYDPIAIVGVSCNLPDGSDNLNKLWEFLINKKDALRETDRFELSDHPGAYTKKCATLGLNVWDFNNDMFNISEAEARLMDPQQFMALHAADEVMKQTAHIDKESCGVFVGCSTNEYGGLVHKCGQNKSTYIGTGAAVSIISNRVSYVLGLQGMSMTIDTACSSSLVALDVACTNLQSGNCSSAIVIGVNTILTGEPFETMCNAKMLSPNGRCATFSDAADGFARGEGCCAVMLKTVSNAIRDQDRIIAVINGSGSNQDGVSANLTSPNGPSQSALIQDVLSKAKIHPDELDFIECHGTGTALGDPIEVQAISNVLGERSNKLPLGALKSNIGHLEGAAGLAGLVKAIMCLWHKKVPPNLHCENINPRIQEFVDKNIVIPTEKVFELDKTKQILYAGISSFGFGGTNAHVIISRKS